MIETRDYILWDSFKNGSEHALSLIYKEHYSALFYYGRKIMQDEELIKDLIHELFEELIRAGARLSDTDNIRYYLLKSLRYKLLKKSDSKVENRTNIKSDHPQFGIVDSIEKQMILDETDETRREQIKEAVCRLSSKQQEIIYLRFYNDMNYEQIAEIFQTGIQTVRNLMHRALRSLQEDLKKNGTDLFTLLFFLNKNHYQTVIN